MPELAVHLLPGGQSEGWTVVELPIGEERVAMVFGPGFHMNQLDTRYVALN